MDCKRQFIVMQMHKVIRSLSRKKKRKKKKERKEKDLYNYLTDILVCLVN